MRSFLSRKTSQVRESKPDAVKAGTGGISSEGLLGIGDARSRMDAQQLRTFTRWWNSWLVKRGEKVEDLLEDVRSGVNPVMLMEVLTGTPAKRFTKKPLNRFQMLENNENFLKEISSKGIRLVGIGAENMVDGDKTMVLGVTWTLILRYEIQRFGIDDPELLRWVRAGVRDYGLEVPGWTESFNDGKVFAGLMAKYAPEFMDWDKSKGLPAAELLQKAFDVAEEVFDVPQLLDPADLAAPGPSDDKSIITYVAKLRQAILDKNAELMKLQAAQQREAELARLAAAKADLEKAKEALLLDASDLVGWTRKKAATFSGAAAAKDTPRAAELLGGTPAETKEKLREFKEDYRQGEKPPRAQQLADLAKRHADVVAKMAKLAAETGDTAAPADLSAASPEALRGEWKKLEQAEADYEAALNGRLGELEAAERAKETDKLAEPLLAAAEKLAKWTADKTGDLKERAHADKLGDTAEETAAKLAELEQWCAPGGEKPVKEDEKLHLQHGLREVDTRRAQEGRDPLPPVAQELEDKWGDLEAATDALKAALEQRAEQHKKAAERAETDKMCAENDAQAKEWLDKVKSQGDDYAGRVRAGTLGGSADETQQLLDELRADFHQKKRPKWAGEKGDIEDGRRTADGRRAQEEREPYPWDPSNEDLSKGWADLNKAANDYEQALLAKLGQLKEVEADALRRRGLRDGALTDLAELLPPLIARAADVDDATAAAAAAVDDKQAGADALMEWVAAEKERLAAKQDGEGKLAAVDLAGVTADLGALKASTEDEKLPKAQALLKMKEAMADATAKKQLYRYAGSPSVANKDLALERQKLGELSAAWDEMEGTQNALRDKLQEKAARLRGAALEFERLKRGCLRVGGWLRDAMPTLACADLGSSEASVITLLAEADALDAPLALQVKATKGLSKLVERLESDDEYGPLAKELFEQIGGIGAWEPALADRKKRLAEELERQRKLAAERLAFAAKVAEFGETVAEATEVTRFPLATDTLEVLSELLALGSNQADGLLPAPEGADAESREKADELMVAWRALKPEVTGRAADAEGEAKASMQVAKLADQYTDAAQGFNAWFDRCEGLLDLDPAVDVVSPADVEKAVEMVQAQAAEGDAHVKRADALLREVGALGGQLAGKGNELSPAEMRAKAAHIGQVAKKLGAAAKSSPPKAEPAPVIAALHALQEGLSTPTAPHTLTAGSLEAQGLAPAGVGFLKEHVPVVLETSALQPDSFNPFPLDGAEPTARPLPDGAMDRQAHGFSVMEHLNRVRTEPRAYAAHLRSRLKGCFDGTTFTPPWPGHKIKTAEGEAAVESLCAFLEAASPLPELRLLSPLVDAAFDSASWLSDHATLSPLEERLAKYGTWSGVAGEAVVYGTRQPEAIVVQLLLSDGDTSRRNRAFLMHESVKVAGFAMAEHATHGAVGVISLFSVFVKSLTRNVSVTCVGTPSAQFDEVLDAVPSDQAREISMTALSQGKEVSLDYTIVQLQITVADKDGNKQVYTLPLK